MKDKLARVAIDNLYRKFNSTGCTYYESINEVSAVYNFNVPSMASIRIIEKKIELLTKALGYEFLDPGTITIGKIKKESK